MANTLTIEPYDNRTTAPLSGDVLAKQVEESIARGPRLILWDLVGSCNLKCPSCPVGNMAGTNPKGLITDERFNQVLAKLSRMFPAAQLHYYNWTEPLIHPRIVQYCEAASKAGFKLHLSSNLNYLKDAEALMCAGVKTFRVSMSGMSQAVYELGHKGGHVERVKANMRRLHDAKAATGSRTKVHVYYHGYRHNQHERDEARAFAESLGFEFITTWAYYMPLEKLISAAEGTLAANDRAFVRSAIVPHVEHSVAIAQRHRDEPCELIDQLVLDHKGHVVLCCAVYEQAKQRIGSILDLEWGDIQRIRYGHSTCDRCMHYGAHALYTWFFNEPMAREMERQAAIDLATDPALESDASGQGVPLRINGRPIELQRTDQAPLAKSA